MCTFTWKLKLGIEKKSIIHSPKKYPHSIRRVFSFLGLLTLLFISALLTWTLALYQMTISKMAVFKIYSFSYLVMVYAWIIQCVFQCSRLFGVICLVHVTVFQVCVGVTLFKFMWNVNKSDTDKNVFYLPFLYCRTQYHFILRSIMITLF